MSATWGAEKETESAFVLDQEEFAKLTSSDGGSRRRVDGDGDGGRSTGFGDGSFESETEEEKGQLSFSFGDGRYERGLTSSGSESNGGRGSSS